MRLYESLEKITAKENIYVDEPMSKHTTFKTGGKADFLVIPQNKAEMIELLKLNVEKTIIGNGSNLLVRDGGIRGLVIKTTALKNYVVEDNIIIAEAGMLLSKLSKIAKENALTGLEFACGIPGTLGGAVMMNASAYGGETSNVVIETEYADLKGNVYKTKEHNFGYRKSMFTGSEYTILESKLKLEHGNKEEIENKMKELMKSRNEKQPVNMPSAGSTFKRPEGHFAGKLIEDAGLKGYKIGGAEVSTLHAGFVINDGSATSEDILNLIKHIQNKVKNEFGVELEPEVKIIGSDKE